MHLCVAIFKFLNFATLLRINRMVLQRLCIRRLSLICRESKLSSYIAESPKSAPKKAKSNVAGIKIEDFAPFGKANPARWFFPQP